MKSTGLINSARHWEQRYINNRDSGEGSYGEVATLKLNLIKEHIPEDEVKSILDFGCGDFVFGSRISFYFKRASYLGIDQSKFIIERNKYIYNSRFTFQEGQTVPPEKFDLVVCDDVLFHIIDEKDYNNLLQALNQSYSKFLILTAFDRNGETSPNGQANIRKINEKLLGQLVVKQLQEKDGACFYIFKHG